ncbi:MAG: hypothetical protein IPK97_19620 [Ahniella sp.]|nr:hypothetical protein [Ahniella sp.]
MWFLFGVVTLSLMVWVSFHIRRSGSWVGVQRRYESPDGAARTYMHAEQTHKGAKTGFQIGINVPVGFDFELRTESGFDQWGKSLGIGAEQSVGDSKFDAEVFIDSDDQRVGAALRQSREARTAVLYLFRMCREQDGKLKRIRAFKGRLWIDVNDKTGLPPWVIADKFSEALHALAEALTKESRSLARVSDPFRIKALLILGMSTGLAIFGLIGLFRARGSWLDLDTESMWVWTSMVGVMLCLVGAVLALRWLRASSRAHYVLAELLTVGMAGSILSVHALAAEFNRDFDLSAPTVYEGQPARVFSENYRCGKGGRSTCTRYDIVIEGTWPAAGREFSINEDTYHRLKRYQRVDVFLKPGLLGGRWISARSSRLGLNKIDCFGWISADQQIWSTCDVVSVWCGHSELDGLGYLPFAPNLQLVRRAARLYVG